jgi:hypothetical protein
VPGACYRSRILQSKHSLVSAPCPFIQGRSSFILTLLMEKESQAVYAGQRVGVLLPQRLLSPPALAGSSPRPPRTSPDPASTIARLLTLVSVSGCSAPRRASLTSNTHKSISLATSYCPISLPYHAALNRTDAHALVPLHQLAYTPPRPERAETGPLTPDPRVSRLYITTRSG